MAPPHASTTTVAAPPGAADALSPGQPARRCGPTGDGVAVCRRILLTVGRDPAGTGGAAELLGRRAADTVGALAVRRSLRALAAARPPACWRPVFQYRHHPRVHPVQFALAGLNAHVGHDLPLAVVDACRAQGAAPERLEREFDRVAGLLALVEEGIREELLTGPEPLEVADPLTHLLGSWSPGRACDSAWSAARLLWRLQDQAPLAEEFAARLDSGTGLVGRCLLTPRR
ncbi:DUF5995 family protein [Streptomyces clavuligerus]|uniref:DUF5995 family protein n=1 Tax=Streptomyces clavuligerus TaxID=1901 RepID=UPI0018D1C103|nr:DUF5995 family protein [Streptomyces clavuligerus]